MDGKLCKYCMNIDSKFINNIWPPKYKSKIERKIDALLTITDTYVHTYISSNLNTSSVVMCFSAAAFAIVVIVVVFSVAWKKMSWKAYLVWLSVHYYMTHTHLHTDDAWYILVQVVVSLPNGSEHSYVCECAVICAHII